MHEEKEFEILREELNILSAINEFGGVNLADFLYGKLLNLRNLSGLMNKAYVYIEPVGDAHVIKMTRAGEEYHAILRSFDEL